MLVMLLMVPSRLVLVAMSDLLRRSAGVLTWIQTRSDKQCSHFLVHSNPYTSGWRARCSILSYNFSFAEQWWTGHDRRDRVCDEQIGQCPRRRRRKVNMDQAGSVFLTPPIQPDSTLPRLFVTSNLLVAQFRTDHVQLGSFARKTFKRFPR